MNNIKFYKCECDEVCEDFYYIKNGHTNWVSPEEMYQMINGERLKKLEKILKNTDNTHYINVIDD